MGGIDLDPASNHIANFFVKATQYFTIETNAENPTLLRPWGTLANPTRVWMNHPFSRGENACVRRKNGELNCKKKVCEERGYHINHDVPGNRQWIMKLIHEVEQGRVIEACCICFAATSETWFTPLYAGTMCNLSPRTNYYLPDGKKKKGVTKGSVVTYFGKHTEQFKEIFSAFGHFPNDRTALKCQKIS